MSSTKLIRNLFIGAFAVCSVNVFAQDATIKEVTIGNQVWMAENLRVNKVNSFAYKMDSENTRVYGRLYTYDAAMKACPAGWHLPSYEEFMKMINALGGVANGSMKLRPGGGSGFNALMAGYRNDKGEFEAKNTDAVFWTSTPFQGNTMWAIQLKTISPKALEAAFDKNTAASCRCVKDSAAPTAPAK